MVNPETGEIPKISELVRQRTDSGINTRELARRSGEVVAHQRFDEMLRGKVSGWPKNAETIAAIAAALGTDSRIVVLSYARELGIDVADNRSMLAAMLPANSNLLNFEQATAVSNLIAAFSPGPQTTEGSSEALNLTAFADDELREVTDLWSELTARAAEAKPALANALSHLAVVLETALKSASAS